MTHPIRAALVIGLATAVVAFAGGEAEARVHHHRHHAAAAASGATSARHRGRHHHGGKPTVVCGRHHRHCHAVASAGRARHVAPPTADESNGMCKSVFIHGQWVQRCNFPDQGQ